MSHLDPRVGLLDFRVGPPSPLSVMLDMTQASQRPGRLCCRTYRHMQCQCCIRSNPRRLLYLSCRAVSPQECRWRCRLARLACSGACSSSRRSFCRCHWRNYKCIEVKESTTPVQITGFGRTLCPHGSLYICTYSHLMVGIDVMSSSIEVWFTSGSLLFGTASTMASHTCFLHPLTSNNLSSVLIIFESGLGTAA